jgi:cation:H+ antiporter
MLTSLREETDMALTLILLVASLIIILMCAELFTNAVEWLGVKLNVNEGVVGSIFAAVGTAMPETLIPIVAVLFVGSAEGAHGEEVGIGAILGAPFMLATLAMFITGLAIWIFSRSGRRTTTLSVNTSILGRDIRFFLIAYLIAVSIAFVDEHDFRFLRILVAIGLLGLYIYYVYRHASEEEQTHELEHEFEAPAPWEKEQEAHEELAPLRFSRRSKNPNMSMVVLQLAVSLGVMVLGARLFVDQVTIVATAVGVPALILSLLIAPVATELPEKFNSVLWVRRSKDTLALGNISGAMVFQSCFPVSFGLIFTSWSAAESREAFISAGMAIAAGTLLWIFMRTGRQQLTASALMICGAFYLAYVVYLAVALLPYGSGAAH